MAVNIEVRDSDTAGAACLRSSVETPETSDLAIASITSSSTTQVSTSCVVDTAELMQEAYLPTFDRARSGQL